MPNQVEVSGVAYAAARVTELRGVDGFVGKLEIAVVDGHQSQAGVERLRVQLRFSYRWAWC